MSDLLAGVLPFLAAWLVASPPALAAQEEERAPGDPDRRLDESLRESLDAVDPLAAGWTSEGRGAAAQERLDLLAGLFRRPQVDLLAELGGLVADGFTCTPLRPAELEVAQADGAFRVLRPGAQATPPPELEGVRGLARALLELRSTWGDDTIHVKAKVVGVTEHDDGFETEVRLEVEGPAQPQEPGDDRVQVTASWSCRWVEGASEEPRLAALRLESFEYVRARDHLFEDCTVSLLDGLAPDVPGVGVGDWRRMLDTRLGQPLLGHPAGIAIGDVDGNGLEDLYLCEPGGVPNQLYLRGSDGRLRNGSRGSGADFLDFSRGALILDLDGDGDRDLVVYAGELVFLANDGRARFNVAASVATEDTTSLAAADYDLDGDLDLYACAYSDPYGGGAFPLPYHDANNGQRNVLLENRGDFEFADVTAARGLDANNTRFSFAASWEDFDRDGDPDLYVANDFGRNNLYRNDGGSFVDVAAAAGVEDVSAGMGVSWGDYDGDGWPDLYVSNMYSSAGNRVAYQRRFHAEASDEVREAYQRHARGNSLFRNMGDGTFVDESVAAGVTMGRWAWGARLVDVNGDGFLDVLSPNGFLTQERADDL